MSSTPDPWIDLVPESGVTSLHARRVDAQSRWNFFWARGADKRCMLILQYSPDPLLDRQLPVLKGIDCQRMRDGSDGKRILYLKLMDSTLQDIFYRFCMDIIATCADSTSEAEVVTRMIGRTWRWHHLLRGGGDSRLSIEEQKGLIGELVVLEKLFLPLFSPRDAINAWLGPLGAPKDFEIGRIAVEVKARRGGATPYIDISSEHQLDGSGNEALYLHVIELDQTPPDSTGAFTLTTIAERICTGVRSADQGAADMLESLLVAAGFRWEDDYSDTNWLRGPDREYLVDKGFPRVTPESFAAGVSRVRYTVSLTQCEQYRVSEESILVRLKGHQYGN
jgi:Putative  PD-(D/E)XK family member, (DUF4420)